MSFVTTLTTDTTTMATPTWADIERAIGLLDGCSQTIVMLAPPPPKGPPEGVHHLAVGGGADGRFLVYTTEDNLDFWNLTDPRSGGAHRTVRLNIGGQDGEYSEAQLVSRDLALRAARRYVDDGERAGDLVWMKA